MSDKLRELAQEFEDHSDQWDSKNDDSPVPKQNSPSFEGYLYGYNAGVSEGLRSASAKLKKALDSALAAGDSAPKWERQEPSSSRDVELEDMAHQSRQTLIRAGCAPPQPGERDRLREAAARAYCDYLDQMRKPECLGYEQKLKEGRFSKAELDAHVRAGEFLGRHRAFNEAALSASAPGVQGARVAPEPYRAENEGGGCKECHHGDDWTVVYAPPGGGDEIGEGETWENAIPAEEMADSLNHAFARGWRAALAGGESK